MLAWWQGYLANSQLVRLPDGRQMNLYCEGQGAPVVLLDAGLGDGSWSWAPVQDQMAAKTRVCAFDHAGFGRSSPGPTPRDSKAIASDLAATLKAAKVPGPYVLVGHSAGSYSMRLFALTHLKDVAGMVLIDPAADNQIPRMSEISPAVLAEATARYNAMKPCAQIPRAPALLPTCEGVLPPTFPADIGAFVMAARRPEFFAAVISETEATATLDSDELVAARKAAGTTPLGLKPLVILTAGAQPRPGMTPEQAVSMQKLWSSMHDEMATLSSRGVNRLVPDAPHYIHLLKPQVVIDAVAEVVDAVRRGH
jgi:pimeloyl-ACP methyl ester carboxylesterase